MTGNWNSGDSIFVNIDGTNKSVKSQGSPQYSSGSICSSGSDNDILDTNDYTHSNSPITVYIGATSTKGTPGTWGFN
jgi:hypothetical protein